MPSKMLQAKIQPILISVWRVVPILETFACWYGNEKGQFCKAQY